MPQQLAFVHQVIPPAGRPTSAPHRRSRFAPRSPPNIAANTDMSTAAPTALSLRQSRKLPKPAGLIKLVARQKLGDKNARSPGSEPSPLKGSDVSDAPPRKRKRVDSSAGGAVLDSGDSLGLPAADNSSSKPVRRQPARGRAQEMGGAAPGSPQEHQQTQKVPMDLSPAARCLHKRRGRSKAASLDSAASAEADTGPTKQLGSRAQQRGLPLKADAGSSRVAGAHSQRPQAPDTVAGTKDGASRPRRNQAQPVTGRKASSSLGADKSEGRAGCKPPQKKTGAHARKLGSGIADVDSQPDHGLANGVVPSENGTGQRAARRHARAQEGTSAGNADLTVRTRNSLSRSIRSAAS